MTSTIESLPLDIMGLFKERVTLQDAKQLRLTSNVFAVLFAAQVMHTMTLDFTAETYQRDLGMLRLLISGKSRANEYTKSLKIRSLTTRKTFPHVNYPDLPHFLLEDLAPPQDEMKESFFMGLSQLTNLESISWIPHTFYEAGWAYSAMNQLLQNLPNLLHFELSMYYLTFHSTEAPSSPPTPLQISFPDMSSLRSIKLTGIRSLHEDNFKRLCQVFGQLRNLNEIYLEVLHALPDHDDDTGTQNQDALLALLSHPTLNATPLPLESLTLRDTIPRLTLPYLAQFRSLKRIHILNRMVGPDTISSLNSFWAALESENIHVDCLGASFVLPSLLSYIESYKTLKGLTFFPMFDGMLTQEDRDRFFAALLNHKDTLERVDIAPRCDSGVWEGRWCASSPENAVVLSQLKELRTARVGVKGLLRRIEEWHDNSRAVLNTVMDTFMELPRMEVLILDTQEECRMSRQFTDFLDPKIGLRNAVRTYVRNIVIPCSARRSQPFIIKWENETYTPHRIGLQGMESWVYTRYNLGQEYDDQPYQNYVYPFDMPDERAVGRI